MIPRNPHSKGIFGLLPRQDERYSLYEALKAELEVAIKDKKLRSVYKEKIEQAIRIVADPKKFEKISFKKSR